MRVITGLAKGKRLNTLEGETVRPTPERVKEAIFSAIHFDLEGRSFLDLFAGSGQMGIEALSRGAAYCLFADANPQAADTVRANVENTGFTENSKVIRGDYAAVLMGLDRTFDFIFLDPPYAAGLLPKAAELSERALATHGLLICEHPKEQPLPDTLGNLKRTKLYKHGRVHFSFYQREVKENE